MPFKPGEGGGRAGRKSPQPSQLLKDMREAWRSPDHEPGESNGLRVCRDMLAQSPDKFVTRLERMEKELRSSKGGPGPSPDPGEPDQPEPVKDEATARCVELAEKLLADLGDRHR